MRRLAPLFCSALLMLTACGSTSEGGACNTVGFLCADPTAALECKGGVWVKLPCRGAGGCKRETDTVRCDMTGNKEGDNCASTAQGRGLCTDDMKGTLECREGKLVKTNTCGRSCTIMGDQVICSP